MSKSWSSSILFDNKHWINLIEFVLIFQVLLFYCARYLKLNLVFISVDESSQNVLLLLSRVDWSTEKVIDLSPMTKMETDSSDFVQTKCFRLQVKILINLRTVGNFLFNCKRLKDEFRICYHYVSIVGIF